GLGDTVLVLPCGRCPEIQDGRARVQFRVGRPAELGETEVDVWRAFQRGDDALASPFLAPEFAFAVGAARDDSRVAVVEDGGEPVAFFAFSTGADGVGAPIGPTICDAQALVASAG